MWKFVHEKQNYKIFERNIYFQYNIIFLLSRPWKKATTCHLSPLQFFWYVWSWNSARAVVMKKSKMIECQVCDKVNFAPASFLWKVRWVVAAFNGLLQTESHKTYNQWWGSKVKAKKKYCCDRKSWAAYAQSFALWQQATIEIMLAISLTIACSRYVYIGIIIHAHPVRDESHIQRNATGKVATVSRRAPNIHYVKISTSRSAGLKRSEPMFCVKKRLLSKNRQLIN